MSEIRILVCGDVNGNFNSLFAKVASIHKKHGPFEYLLCVGSFFSSDSKEWEDVKSGKIKAPITTYVLGANAESDAKFYQSEDLAPNIIYLGKKGSVIGSSGLRIAYLSGVELSKDARDKNIDKNTKSGIYFTEEEVTDLISSIPSDAVVDILVTSQWPQDITKYAIPVSTESTKVDECSSSLISLLAKEIKPRYHFCGLAGLYYTRVPYRNHAVLQESPVHVTRFLALAPVNDMQKWLYAFKIVPACHMSHKELSEYSNPITNCPYDTIEDLNADKAQNEFFFGRPVSSKQKRTLQTDKPEYEKSKKRQSIEPGSCWFCFSNSEVEKQLVISVGSYCYMTLAKGMLVPEHVLIIPINHAISSVELPDAVLEEINKFKKSLIDYFHDKNKDVVFFERNYMSPHVQIQAVPVPKQLKFKIQEALLDAADEEKYDFAELPRLACVQKVVSKKKPFFYFELIVDKKTEAKYLHMINKKFPLQFGRAVLASSKVLNVPERVDWRQCEDSKTTEQEMTEKMREEFASYDFTKV